MAAFIQEGKMSVDKDWFTMAVSRGIISLEHSNSKDVGIGSRTHVLGDICFMNFNTFPLVTLSNPHTGVPKKRRSLRLCEGMNNLDVNGITDLASLADQKSQKRPVEVGQWGRQKAVGWM